MANGGNGDAGWGCVIGVVIGLALVILPVLGFLLILGGGAK
jgi:hypothetical protein